MVKRSIYLFLVLAFSMCHGNSKNTLANIELYSTDKNRLVKKTISKVDSHLISIQYFNRDTLPNGTEITYYPNGKIEKWKLYDKTSKYPYGIAYYNPDGSFDTFRGHPFVRLYQIDSFSNDIRIVTLNPPNVKYIVEYIDSFGNKCVIREQYRPAIFDSSSGYSWMQLRDHFDIPQHHYWLHYLFLNSVEDSIVLDIPIEMGNLSNPPGWHE